jgi:3-oxoacyl-[acyl-carrier protein] reductase
MKKRMRVVVVTGGGSGMGRMIAQRFASDDHFVYILGRREHKLLETMEGYATIKAVVADVTDLNSIQSAVQTITKQHKVIDVLVNCAGGNQKVDSSATMKEAHAAWNAIVDVNLTSVFNMIFACQPFLARPGGRIINVTSMAALGGSRQGGVSGQAYSAAKAGIHGMSRTLVNQLAPDGITINCVAPGVIEDTDFFPGGKIPEDLANFYLAKIPVGRLGKPDEIASGVFYLASPDAGFISGEILNINGGAQFGR